MALNKPVTRRMVAEEAGVSETVVSYVINNNRYVDKEKRERVEQAISSLGYHPNAIARSLKSKRSNHILFIADQIDNEHFGKLISEMDGLLYDDGYIISLVKNRNNNEFIQHLISRQIDGVIISSISMREQYIRAIAEAGVSVVVLMNRDYTNLPKTVGKIYTGLYDGACTCVRYLYDTGCRQILYVDRMSVHGNFSNFSDLRLRGYLDTMAQLNLPVDTTKVITGCASDDEVIDKIQSHVKNGIPIDAIFARNDRMASIAMFAVKGLGLSVPGDTSIVGFDDSNLSRYTTPSLTTVAIDRKGAAQAAVNLIKNMEQGDDTPPPIQLTTTLVVRESTKPVKVNAD